MTANWDIMTEDERVALEKWLQRRRDEERFRLAPDHITITRIWRTKSYLYCVLDVDGDSRKFYYAQPKSKRALHGDSPYLLRLIEEGVNVDKIRKPYWKKTG